MIRSILCWPRVWGESDHSHQRNCRNSGICQSLLRKVRNNRFHARQYIYSFLVSFDGVGFGFDYILIHVKDKDNSSNCLRSLLLDMIRQLQSPFIHFVHICNYSRTSCFSTLHVLDVVRRKSVSYPCIFLKYNTRLSLI